MKRINVFQPDESELEKRCVSAWPVWSKGVSSFPWTYDENEECYITEGEVVVTADEEKWQLRAGDFVTFAKGLTCHWDILQPVSKHYNFL